jgi:phosphonate transport system substrate-binding protein
MSEPNTPSNTSSNNASSKPGVRISVIVLIELLLAAVLGAAAFYVVAHRPQQVTQNAEQEFMIRLSGLQSPVTNKLDARYTDADGNLVADAPTDVAKQIDPEKILFSYVHVSDPTAFKAAFADLAAAIEKATGKSVEYVEFESDQDQILALRDGKLHVTALNTGNVPLAVCAAGFVPVAAPGNDKGTSRYEMELLVRSDSPIKTVADIKGRELTLTTRSSNSGCKAPLVFLKTDHALLPGRDFGVRYSGGHEKSILGLVSKTFEVVAVANDVLRRELAKGTIKTEQFRSIYKSESFPTASIGYASNLKPELAQKIRKTLVEFDWNNTSLQSAFTSSGQTRFVPVDYKNDWALVRKIDDNIGFTYKLRDQQPAP